MFHLYGLSVLIYYVERWTLSVPVVPGHDGATRVMDGWRDLLRESPNARALSRCQIWRFDQFLS